MLTYNFTGIHISISIFIILMIFWCLFYILEELDSELKFFQNSNNREENPSPEDGDKKPSGDGKPDPEDASILAFLLRFCQENKREILIGIAVSSLIIGIGIVIKQSGLAPDLSGILPDLSSIFGFGKIKSPLEEVKLPPEEYVFPFANVDLPQEVPLANVDLPPEEYVFPFANVDSPQEVPLANVDLPSEGSNLTLEEIVHTNTIVASTLQIPRFEFEPLPDYFDNLMITETNFIAGMGGFPTYASYKEGLLKNFLILYDNIDRNIVDIRMLKPGILNSHSLEGHNLRDIYTIIMKEIPANVAKEVIKVQFEIIEGSFQEELFLVSKPHLLAFMNDLLRLLQGAIQTKKTI